MNLRFAAFLLIVVLLSIAFTSGTVMAQTTPAPSPSPAKAPTAATSSAQKTTAAPAHKALPVVHKAVNSDEDELDAGTMAEAQAIINDVKMQNPPDALKLKIMTGVMQLVTSSTEAVDLGSGNTTLAVGIDGNMHLFGNVGLEAREVYTQNIIPDKSSVNMSNAYMSWFDGGPTYTFYLDSTRLEDNIIVKFLYHENYNNLQLNDPFALFVNYYAGFAASFERNIPITNKLGITGMFDLLQIVNTASPSLNQFQGSTPTHNTVAKSGYGFEIQAEIYYKFIFGSLPARIGFEYWQQGNQSELDDSLKQSLGQESYFQVTRALFGTMSVLF